MGQGYSSDATSALFGAKFRIFQNLWCVCTDNGEGELSQCGHFENKEKWAIFWDFVRTSFMDGLLLFTLSA